MEAEVAQVGGQGLEVFVGRGTAGRWQGFVRYFLQLPSSLVFNGATLRLS